MKFLERDLEDIIFEAENLSLNARGLPIHGEKRRQVRIGNYGICDLITVEKHYNNGPAFFTGEIYPYLNITIYELKRDFITVDAFLQGIRYIKGLDQYFCNRNSNTDLKFNLILIGSCIDKSSDLLYIPDLFTYDIDGPINSIGVRFYTYEYDFDGIRFTPQRGYKLLNEGF